MEATPEEYVARMVAVCRGVREALTDDGTLWLNVGDCYASTPPGCGADGVSQSSTLHGVVSDAYRETLRQSVGTKRSTIAPGLKPKDLVGIPWRLAFALQADGWWLRSDIIWAKPNPMPESVRDRPTKAHEYVFLLSKRDRYYFGQEAVREPPITQEWPGIGPQHGIVRDRGEDYEPMRVNTGRNLRSVWTIATEPCPDAHFATMPTALAERCIKAGSAPGDTVLDPFAGSGTTLGQAVRLGRSAVGIELNPAYIEIAHRRIARMLETTEGQVALFGGLTPDEGAK